MISLRVQAGAQIAKTREMALGTIANHLAAAFKSLEAVA